MSHVHEGKWLCQAARGDVGPRTRLFLFFYKRITDCQPRVRNLIDWKLVIKLSPNRLSSVHPCCTVVVHFVISNCDAKIDATLIEIYTPEYTFVDISWSHIILGEQNHACKAPPCCTGMFVCLFRERLS